MSHPSETYKFVNVDDDSNPTEWENKKSKWQPKHQISYGIWMPYVGLLLLVASHLKTTVKSPEEFFTKAPRSWMHQGTLGGLGEALGEAYFWVPL